MQVDKLIELAKEARQRAYAPYSKFPVGAALLSQDGQVFLGCNVENAAYSTTNCAERTAIFKAVSEGITRFAAIAIVADTEGVCSPCGVCRQVMEEFFGDDTLIYLANLKGDVEIWRLSGLLPGPFGKQSLGGDQVR